ncbi:MAG: ATP-binding cassette domain-containing protein [Clostridia bacterium]
MNGLAIDHVCITIGKAEILSDVCCEVRSGELIGFIGHNGSGKSMLFKCLCGFIRPSKGSVRIDEVDYYLRRQFPPHIGFLIESPAFLQGLSGMENLRQFAQIRGKIGDEAIRETIRLVGLDPDEHKAVRKYSMGMKQRLGIAQAIMEETELLILDEPMNGLDDRGVEDMRRLLLALKTPGLCHDFRERGAFWGHRRISAGGCRSWLGSRRKTGGALAETGSAGRRKRAREK